VTQDSLKFEMFIYIRLRTIWTTLV